MSGFSSTYLSTRLKSLTHRLIGFPRLTGFIEYDLAQIQLHVTEITGQADQFAGEKPRRIEELLNLRALNDFEILVRPLFGAERRFFYFFIRWFELVNLKVLIRGKFSSTQNSIIRDELVDLGRFADLPIQQLLETEDPYEMLRLLETTTYAGVVRQARRVYEEYGNDLFLLDATIDRSFFIDLYRRADYLRHRDGVAVGYVLGSLLDRFNLLWLLRYRFSYNLSPAKSFYLLTAFGNRLKSADLLRLAKLDSIDQVAGSLPEPYRRLLSQSKTIAEFESEMVKATLVMARDVLEKKSNLLAGIFAYILLREAEVRFLHSLIKAKQFLFGQELIQQAVGDFH